MLVSALARDACVYSKIGVRGCSHGYLVYWTVICQGYSVAIETKWIIQTQHQFMAESLAQASHQGLQQPYA